MSDEAKKVCSEFMSYVKDVLKKGDASDRREVVRLKLRIDRMLNGHVEEK